MFPKAAALALALLAGNGDQRTTAYVVFETVGGVRALCGDGNAACAVQVGSRSGVIVMPDPCSSPADDYAKLLCHEIRHLHGWRHP